MSNIIKGINLPSNINKSDMQDISNGLIQSVEDGFTSEIQALEQLKAIKAIIDLSIKRVEELALNKYADTKEIPCTISKSITYVSGRKNYDFSNNEIITSLENKIKKYKEMAKKIKKETAIVDTETGETITLIPPIVTYSKDSLNIKFND